MKKTLIVLAVVGLFVSACNNTAKTDKKSTETSNQEVACCENKVSVDSFLTVAENYVGKEMVVYGTVDHVCKHGGKRVKMFSSCASKTIHVEATEEMGKFDAELEGSDICVTGIVAEHKMDSAYVAKYETSVKESIEKELEEAEMDHTKGADHHATLEKIEKWKEEMATNGKGYISTYYIEAYKYKECDSKNSEGCKSQASEGKGCKSEGCKSKDSEGKGCKS